MKRTPFGGIVLVILAWAVPKVPLASAQVEWEDLFPDESASKPKRAPESPPASAEPKRIPAPKALPLEDSGELTPQGATVTEEKPVAREKLPFKVKRDAIARPATEAPGVDGLSGTRTLGTSSSSVSDRGASSGHDESTPAEMIPTGRSSSMMKLANFGFAEGDVIDRGNYQRHTEVLSPGQQWLVAHGMRLQLVDPLPVPPPRPYTLVTEKYSGQVALGPGGNSLLNYTAGQPFPHLDANDPELAKKVMWNFYHNYNVIDDVAQRDFEPKTGTISDDGTMRIERAFIVGAYRKLNYTGRLFVDPKPELPNAERVRFKESVHPIIEPFDLKGVGFTSYRYLDADKQDDSWVYLPQLRRIRRLSSAQRSDALFGQDTDADAFAGYNGHIAWMDFRLLGEMTMMAVLHARNTPLKLQAPEDWIFDDVWEPRQVWIIEAVSKFPQYAYGKRILFIDKETYLIPSTDSYDRAGQLWKVQLTVYSHKKESTPDAVLGRYDDDMIFQHGNVIVDTQLEHATTTAIPSTKTNVKDAYLHNMGSKSGTTEDFFNVAHMIATGK